MDHTPPPPQARGAVTTKYGMWECVVCGLSMMLVTRASHLRGTIHAEGVAEQQQPMVEEEKQEEEAVVVDANTALAQAQDEVIRNAERGTTA